MATILSGNKVKKNDGTIVDARQGEWYDGQHFMNGSLGPAGVVNDPNAVGYGNRVSNEVAAQTNPNNVSYIDSQIRASQIQAPINVSYSTNASSQYVSGLNSAVESARRALDGNLSSRLQANDAQLATVKQKEQDTLDKIGELSTPFRENLENTERDRLKINENFDENQKLVDELDQLLTEGNNLIKQQQSVTGIAAIRNPRIQKTMNDVAARAGVIQAVMAARNNQISVAENMIDRSISAIAQDRNDQLSYYQTILQLNNQDKISLTDDNKLIAQQQIALLQGDLEQAQTTANYVKQMMLDPAKAQLMADSGVTLNDSVEVINQKLAQGSYLQEVRDVTNEYSAEGAKAISDPSGVPAKQLRSFTDSRGVTHYFKMPAAPVTTYTSSTVADSWLTSTVNSPVTNTQNTTNTGNLFQTSNGLVNIDLLWADVLSNPQESGSATIRK